MLKGDKMTGLDSFKEAKKRVSAAGKSAGFKSAMNKCDFAAAFRDRGLDVNAIDVVNNK